MKLDFKTITIVALVIVILGLITCNLFTKKLDPVNAPIVKTVVEQMVKIVKDSIESQRIKDSLGLIVEKERDTTDFWKRYGVEAVRNYRTLESAFDQLLNDSLNFHTRRDTIRQKYNDLKIVNAKKDSAYSKTIGSLSRQISLKEKLIAQGDTALKKLRVSFDTCIKDKAALIAYSDKIKPRNKVAFGLAGNIYPEPGIGAGFSFIHKKGMVLDADVMRMNKAWYVGFGVKKVISFKR